MSQRERGTLHANGTTPRCNEEARAPVCSSTGTELERQLSGLERVGKKTVYMQPKTNSGQVTGTTYLSIQLWIGDGCAPCVQPRIR